ncbi:hypothetical protein C2G38_2204465 [Gigaspora rosea]|uniref:Nudix hydrolase domain-containing protein n=1 Tax=Gigaspora rosea TaxID=44941 RepID=A0A397UP58_9GLOM|nr:hypothetical protein C2G38_2204465 [Gigaspora rosea]
MTQLILFTEIENETYILLAQRVNPNKDFYLKLNGPGGKAIHEKNENIDVYVIRECFEEAEIKAEPCLQREASHIITLAIYIHPLEELPKHTEPHNLGPWNLYKMEELLKHRNELISILEKNIELIDIKIKTYEQDILELPINAQKLKEIKIKMGKQPQRTRETFNFFNDIELEIPEEEVPEIIDEQFPVLALNFGKLSSFEIQTLIKYKKKIQELIRPLKRIEHKIQTIEKSYKGFKYLSIFDKTERKTIAQRFGENPTILELSKDNTIPHKFQNTIFEFEIHKSSTNKLTIGGIVSPNFFQTKTILAISVLNYARLFWGFNEELGEDKNKDPVDVGAKKIGSNIAYFIEIAKAKSKHSDLDDIKIKPYKISDLCHPKSDASEIDKSSEIGETFEMGKTSEMSETSEMDETSEMGETSKRAKPSETGRN